MKIIKAGKVEKKIYRRTCSECNTEFEYGYSDIDSDRQGSYVICPLEKCGTCINHDTKFLVSGESTKKS